MAETTKRDVIDQLIAAIATVEEIDPERLDTVLYNAVSTDAIGELVVHESNAWRLQFETHNHIVEITGNNIILVDGQRMGTVT